MIRHIVLWEFRPEFSPEEKQQHAEHIKTQLESLKTVMSGIVESQVIIAPLAGSDKDLMLTMLFESIEALEAYQAHPEHVRIASFIRSVVHNRCCMDYEE